MERQGRIAAVGVLMAFAVIIFTGCTTEKQTEAAKGAQQRTEHDAEKSVSADTAQALNQETEQTPKDERLQKTEQTLKDERLQETEQTLKDEESKETAGKKSQDDEKRNLYRPLMEAAIEAIEADDAQALYDLQNGEEAKALAATVRNGEHFIYYLGEEESGKGIGFYTFEKCSCKQWYYGDYRDGIRQGRGIWYYVSSSTEDGSLYKEVYNGDWKEDAPNGKGRQLTALGGNVDTNKKYKVKNGLFYGTYKIKDKLEDGTVVRGKYRLKKGKYVTISDEELEANNFAVPEEPHLAIAFLYNKAGELKSCSMVYAEDVTRGVKHFCK